MPQSLGNLDHRPKGAKPTTTLKSPKMTARKDGEENEQTLDHRLDEENIKG